MSEQPQKILPEDLANLKDYINNTVSSVVIEQITPRLRAWKIQEESIFSTLESLQNAISFMQKEFNHKIGGIRSQENRKEKESMTVTSLDDAIALANKIRADKGLPPLQTPTQTDQRMAEKPEPGPGKRTRTY